jgi:hypothetical protein
MQLEPKCLLPNCVLQSDGVGPQVELAQERGKLLVATLSIDDSLERHSLSVSIWGSADGAHFEPLTRFRPQQYLGIYSTLLNLSARPAIGFLRVQWSIERERKGKHAPPLFSFQVFLEESGARLGVERSLRLVTHSVGAPKWSRSRGHAA